MFNFFGMMDNYEDRKVGRFDGDDGLMISTASITDGDHPYETAVRHADYNDGKTVIVEAYDTRGEAEAGHARWLATMTAAELPDELRECGNSGVQQLCDAVDLENIYPRKPAA